VVSHRVAKSPVGLHLVVTSSQGVFCTPGRSCRSLGPCSRSTAGRTCWRGKLCSMAAP
jgi:hypothetical protein